MHYNLLKHSLIRDKRGVGIILSSIVILAYKNTNELPPKTSGNDPVEIASSQFNSLELLLKKANYYSIHILSA